MKVSTNIDELIEFLQKKKEEGYEKVELIDDARANGWISVDRRLEFVVNENEPKVLGIDVRKQ